MYKFTHVTATSLQQATSALSGAGGRGQVIAGGTDLITYMKGMITPNPPTTIVDIKTVSPSLSYIKEEGGNLKIGATTTITAIAGNATVQSKYTALAQAAQLLAAPELRNMGTIGGNICQKVRCLYYRNEYNAFNCLRKNPSGICYALIGFNRTWYSIFGPVNGCIAANPSDTAPVLVAMNAKIVTTKKTWNAADFFGVPNVPDVRREQINNLDADEIVTEIQVPTPAAGTKSAYLKFRFRKAIDFPLVSVAVMAGTDGGNVSNASIVLGGVYNLPRRATDAQNSINGKAIDNNTAAAAGTAAITGNVPMPMNNYKLQITKVLVARALLTIK